MAIANLTNTISVNIFNLRKRRTTTIVSFVNSLEHKVFKDQLHSKTIPNMAQAVTYSSKGELLFSSVGPVKLIHGH